MAKYVVVITPEAGANGAADEFAQATIWVDTEPSAPRITEMTIRSTVPGGLFASPSRSIDFEGVLRALNAGVPGVSAVPAMPAPPVSPDDSPVVTETTRPRDQASLQNVQASFPEQTPKNDPAVPSASSVLGVEKGERMYRRMPDASEVTAAYERIGSVVGLAKHYGVPRHTAQGWMTRIRKVTK